MLPFYQMEIRAHQSRFTEETLGRLKMSSEFLSTLLPEEVPTLPDTLRRSVLTAHWSMCQTQCSATVLATALQSSTNYELADITSLVNSS